MKNNTNDFTKRTVNNIKGILNQDENLKGALIENMGSGRCFSINRTDIKTRFAIKRTFGFIITEVTTKAIYFKAF